MNDTKILQMILDGQLSIRKDVKYIHEEIKDVSKKIDRVEERLTKRIDTLGAQLAYLEDDAPTQKEFNKLERRVSKIETQITSQ